MSPLVEAVTAYMRLPFSQAIVRDASFLDETPEARELPPRISELAWHGDTEDIGEALRVALDTAVEYAEAHDSLWNIWTQLDTRITIVFGLLNASQHCEAVEALALRYGFQFLYASARRGRDEALSPEAIRCVARVNPDWLVDALGGAWRRQHACDPKLASELTVAYLEGIVDAMRNSQRWIRCFMTRPERVLAQIRRLTRVHRDEVFAFGAAISIARSAHSAMEAWSEMGFPLGKWGYVLFFDTVCTLYKEALAYAEAELSARVSKGDVVAMLRRRETAGVCALSMPMMPPALDRALVNAVERWAII